MADQMENIIGVEKRRIEHDGDDEPHAKRQKLDSQTALKITDLNETCLMHIFRRLDLSDLLNVAMSNKKLQLAAASTFAAQFGTTTICLQNVNPFNPPRIHTLDDDIHVRGLKLCLPFLRCFGAHITAMRVFDGSYPHAMISKEYESNFSHHVDRYLNQYCSESLSSILFYGRPAFSVEHFRNPFRMVKRMRLIDMALESTLPNFGDWFPDLCHLEMSTVCIYGPLNTAALPVLTHLALKINTNDNPSHCEWNFTAQNVCEFLSQNRQLQSIEIDLADRQTITIEQLLDLIKRNPNISKIMITDGSLYETVSEDELERFVKERQLLVEIDLPRHRFTVENVQFFVRHLKSLRKFRFHMTDWSDYSQVLQYFGDSWRVKLFHQTIELTSLIH